MSSSGGPQLRITHTSADAERAPLVAGREEDRLPGSRSAATTRSSSSARTARGQHQLTNVAVRQHRPGLVAGRQEDRVPEQAERRRQRLRDERGRLRPEAHRLAARRGSAARRSPRPRARRRRPARSGGPCRAPGEPARRGCRRAGAPCCAPRAATSSGQRCTSSRSVGRRSAPRRSRAPRASGSASSSGVTSDRAEREREVAALRGPEPGGRARRRRARAPVQSFASVNPPIAPSAPIIAASAEPVLELLDALGVGQLLLRARAPGTGFGTRRRASPSGRTARRRARPAGRAPARAGRSRRARTRHARARLPPPVKNACSVCAASWTTPSPSIVPGQPRSSSSSRGVNMHSLTGAAGSVCTTTSAISGASTRSRASISLAREWASSRLEPASSPSVRKATRPASVRRKRTSTGRTPGLLAHDPLDHGRVAGDDLALGRLRQRLEVRLDAVDRRAPRRGSPPRAARPRRAPRPASCRRAA